MPTESFNLLLALVGIMVLLVGLYSRSFKSIVAPPMVAMAIGALLGPLMLGWLRFNVPGSEALHLLEQLTRIAVATSVMGIALRFSPETLRTQARPGALMFLGAMVLMWLISGSLVWAVLGVSVLQATLIAAIVTPTDPVVASSITVGPFASNRIPNRLRKLIALESGANDGLAYLLVFLPMLLLQRPAGEALSDWLLWVLLWEVVGAIAIGAALGWVVGRGFLLAERIRSVERSTVLVAGAALALLTLGVLKLAGTDGILAVFVAGLAFSVTINADERTEENEFEEGINQLMMFPALILFGMLIPWHGWRELGWTGIALVVAVLLLRRLPVVLALSPMLWPLRHRADTVFVGWFGPIGLSALFYALLAHSRLHDDLVWHSASLVIAGSVLVHGLTAAPFTRWYARVAGHADP